MIYGDALRSCRGDKIQAAELGIGRTTRYRKTHSLGVTG
jgi:transcriptional regulator of acetoin/glycerol metabolism